MVSRLGTETSPSSGVSSTDDYAKQGGFARAVGADQADLVAGVQLKGGVNEACRTACGYSRQRSNPKLADAAKLPCDGLRGKGRG